MNENVYSILIISIMDYSWYKQFIHSKSILYSNRDRVLVHDPMNDLRIIESWYWYFVADLLVDFVARNRIHELHRGHQGNRICYRNEMGKEHIIFSDTQNKNKQKITHKIAAARNQSLTTFLCVCLKRLVSCWTLWYTLT